MKTNIEEIPFEELLRQNKRLRLIIKCIILFLLIIIILLLLFKKNIIPTIFTLKGDEVVVVNFGDEYKDEGFNAKLYNKNIKKSVKVTNNVNYKKIGNYEIKYNLKIKNLNIDKTIIRKVNVVDTVPPELTVNSDIEVYANLNETYAIPQATAKDNYDGDISKNIKVENNLDVNKEGTYTVKYTVEDSSKNKTEKEIKVTVREKYKNCYIEISISNQTLNYYENGKVVISTPVVTGYGGDTPYGSYSVLYKTTHAHLVGANNEYDTYVNYWMAFIGNSHGMHDATWRNYFGGDIYTYNPTHGCVNIPYSAMEQLYYSVEEGTPVYVVE